jgi:hypothetical protein
MRAVSCGDVKSDTSRAITERVLRSAGAGNFAVAEGRREAPLYDSHKAKASADVFNFVSAR